MTTHGYCRVSTKGQSLEAQLEALDFCDEVYQEKLSGADRNRPQLEYILKIIKAGDVLVVTKLDRLARSTKDLLDMVETLEKKKASLKIININLDTATPTGRLMLTMLGAIAEFERTLMLERQSEGIARARREGKFKGRKGPSAERVAKVIELTSQGVSRADTARQVGCNVAVVYRILKAELKSLKSSIL